jgi:hypothetical protein
MVLLVFAPQGDAAQYADLRQSIAAISTYVLLPSLAIALVSGLLSMLVHQPFIDMGWVWIKALLGILMFKGVLTIVSAKADYAAAMADRIAAGSAPPDALQQLLVLEWSTLWIVMAMSVANVVLGIWRPKFARPAKAEPVPAARPGSAGETQAETAPRPVAANAPGAAEARRAAAGR